MRGLTKTLITAVLVLACSTAAVDGINSCLSGTECRGGQTDLYFDFCDMTDDDLDDLKTCFTSVGRGGIIVLTLEGDFFETIPSDLFEGMTSLQFLDLSDNSISTLDPSSFRDSSASLRNLFILRNKLETIPPNLVSGMPALQQLDLIGNGLTSLPVDAFLGLPTLVRLSLQNNALTTLPAGIFDEVGTDGRLEIASLEGNSDLQCMPAITASTFTTAPTGTECGCEPAAAVSCDAGLVCASGFEGYTCVEGDTLSGDPHMTGLRGQRTEWSGVDGGWYSLIKDHDHQLDINVLLTAPLPADFPNRQLVTGLSVISDGHSLVIEVQDPYSVATTGCVHETMPCLADGGLRVTYDDNENIDLMHPVEGKLMHPASMVVSAANLPTECTKFGGDKIWAETFANMEADHRHLDDDQSFEDWVASSRTLAAPEWCAKYISERGLAQVQSQFATFRIQTAAVTVRLNVGVNYQGGGETDWDGRVLPDLEFWQMDVGLANLHIGEGLTGILGETSRPSLDEDGGEILEGPGVIRGDVEDYRLSGPLDLTFALPPSPQ